jgi:hypothetical protein
MTKLSSKTAKLLGLFFLVLVASLLSNIFYQTFLVIDARPRFNCYDVQPITAITQPPAIATRSAQLDTTRAAIDQKYQGTYRAEGNTFVTFPEWYIVYSAREYAASLAQNWPSSFRYHDATKQYWQAFSCLTKRAESYPVGEGYIFSLKVIGVSFSLENSFRAFHEYTVGRIFENLSDHRSAEDTVQAAVANQYATFLDQTPFYEFPYFSAFTRLWQQTSLFGSPVLRSWERKLFLSFEYLLKAGYGAAIKAGTAATFDPEVAQTLLITDELPADLLANLGSQITVVENLPNQMSLLSAPRYQALQPVLLELALHHITVYEIAGNSHIHLTLLADPTISEQTLRKIINSDFEYVFNMEKLDNPNQNRIGVVVPVVSLSKTLDAIHANNEILILEHIYDY